MMSTPIAPPTPLQLSHMLPSSHDETEQVPPPLTPLPLYPNILSIPSVAYPGPSQTPLGYPGTLGPPSVGYPSSVGMYSITPAPSTSLGYPSTPASPTPLSHMEEMPHLQPDQIDRKQPRKDNMKA
ncbi:hypothetical protein RN001_008788 [Aquatica leii]|uniref:Uncharacterized protein n=1 Tax=Aquatica leii TaxID=1421715 RepID=A0AAN7PZH1_9COLE|nr:hypothetical protein RN001_008788 [Aquatica leii]